MMGPEKNKIPDGVRRIHLIAVCGTGMGALACMLKEMGFEVTGSDQKVYPPMSRFLKEKGISITEGFSEKNLAYGPDLVVVGNAVTKNNPEAVKMQDMGLYYCSMPQALNRFVASGKQTLLVSGTHGKTTTAALVSWILYKAGLDPSFFIGGILNNFQSNYRLGNGQFLVIEGDEYDTAYFNKVPKLMHYHPHITVLTSIEYDHADIYRDMNQVIDAFEGFLSRLSSDSILFAYDGDKTIDAVVANKRCRVIKYGKGKSSFWTLSNTAIHVPWTSFEAFKKGKIFGQFKTTLLGEHNLLNTLSAIAMADQIKIPGKIIGAAIETFQGVKRRQEIRGTKRGITVMDDFAYHPTAVRETIWAVKPLTSNGRLIAVFEPRTHASMRKVFQKIYPASFEGADLICVREPPMLFKVPPEERFSSQKLVDDLNQRGKDAHYFSNTDAIIGFLITQARSGDLILIMSNGGFDNIHERLLAAL